MAIRLLDKNTGTRRAAIGGLVFGLVVLVAAMVVMASVPPVSRDALTHHLAIPKLFVQHGLLAEFPDIPFSYYPMNLDLLYVLPLAAGHDIAAKYIHLLFGLLTAALVYRYLRMRTNILWALCGALLWLSTPIVVRLSSEVYVDLGLAFFSTAAMYSILRWAESDGRRYGLIGAGVWCGLALGTKYNALIVLAILVLMLPFIHIHLKTLADPDKEWQGDDPLRAPAVNTKALLNVVLFVGVALVVFSPWMVRNAYLKGNPIYPMLNRVFNPESSSAGENWSRTATMVQDTSNTLTVRRLVFKESPGYIALIPLRIFIEGRDDNPRYFDGKLNPFLLAFLPFALVWRRYQKRRLAFECRVWFAFAALFMLMAFFLAPIRIRYLLPILPAICVLAVVGMYAIDSRLKTIANPAARRMSAAALAAAIVLMFGYNAAYVVERYERVDPLTYLRGQVSRAEYISQRRPEYSLVQHVNATLAADACVLALFLGQRSYYFDREVIFNEGWLVKAVKEANDPEAIKQSLKAQGITHLVVRRDLFQQWLPITLTPDEINRLAMFWETQLEKLKDSRGFALYMIE